MKLVNGELEVTEVFESFYEAYLENIYKVFVLEGGSRSSKTISIIQFLLLYAQATKGTYKRVIISRAVGTWITATVLNDFFVVLKAMGWYNENDFRQTPSKIYKLFDCEFWFVGLDDQQKLHGMTSNVVWINEAIEAHRDDFDQLEMRCSEFVILDYNPSAEEHWIYDNVVKRPDCRFIHSTMLNNAFLPDNMRRKILSYEPTPENYANGTADKNKWEIYGLGKRAKIEGLIFTNVEIVDNIPDYITQRYTGLDFGYSVDPTAIPEVAIYNNDLYIDELCYQTHMLSKDIVKKLKEVNEDREIISESADPRLVDEIRNAGFRIEAVKKGKESVQAGLDKMKTMRIKVTARSVNAIKEFRNYKNKQDKRGNFLNEPVDDFNHIIDAVRYVVLMKLLGTKPKQDLKKVASLLR